MFRLLMKIFQVNFHLFKYRFDLILNLEKEEPNEIVETTDAPVDQDISSITDRYCSIPIETTTENLPTIFLHSETNGSERLFPKEETPYENDEPNDSEERISECYEITYEISEIERTESPPIEETTIPNVIEISDENVAFFNEDYSIILEFMEKVLQMDMIESEPIPSETTL